MKFSPPPRAIFACPIVYVNQVGGNDQLVFDGTSFAMNPEGEVIACAASFEEDMVLVDTKALTGERHDNHPDECDAVYQALVAGHARLHSQMRIRARSGRR